MTNFRCQKCEFTTTRKDKLREHTFSKHYQKKFKCPECSVEFNRNDNLARHMKNHVDISIRVPEQLCKDIKSSKDETSMYKRKDTHSDGLDESPGDEIDDKELKKRLAHDNKLKRKLWKKIYEIRRVLDQNIKKLEWVSPQTGVDAGGGVNGYQWLLKRTRENTVCLTKTFDLKGCLNSIVLCCI